jgi:outer membrane protein assembly factor BamB
MQRLAPDGIRPGRIADYLAIAVAVVSALYMTIHRPETGVNDLLPGGRRYAAIGIVAAAIIVAGLTIVARRGMVARLAMRTVLYCVTLVLAWIALTRVEEIRLESSGRGVARWPPRPEDSHATRLQTLTPSERASWGARVAAHWFADSLVSGDSLTIPAGWPFPDDVELAVSRIGVARAQIWSRAADGTVACLPIPSRAAAGDSVGQVESCEKAGHAPAGLRFVRPQRVTVPIPKVTSSSTAPVWLQHRGDPAKSGISNAAGNPRDSWLAQLDGPIRSAVSVTGDLVLIGAHGTGDFEALDITTGRRRWSARMPNWVHQDAVSDGRVVVGSVWPAFAGREPSGVAAYELGTGRHLWTAFDESSVMTSPVIAGSTLIYATAAGVLRKRALASGALVAQRRLPGGVIMGPPAIRGDTLVVGLEANRVCALLASTLDPLWCQTFAGLRLMGHTAPTIAGSAAIVSAVGLLRSLSIAEFRHLPLSMQRKLITTIFGPEEVFASQRFMALDLRDGHVLWKSRAFPATRVVRGHTSGTATVSGDVGVIVLPVSDSVVAFRLSSGDVLWTAGARMSRGAPLVFDERVVVAGRDGVIDVRDLKTGALTCSLRHKAGFDRAGPTVAGNIAILADLQGEVEAIPIAKLLGCTH